MQEGIHYRELVLENERSNYTTEDRHQDHQDILTALGMISDPRVLGILARPTYQLNRIYFESNMQRCGGDQVTGCIPGDEANGIKINRIIPEGHYGHEENTDLHILANLAPTRVEFIAAVLLHEVGHRIYQNLETRRNPHCIRLFELSNNEAGPKVSVYAGNRRGHMDYPDYFPETLVGTLFYADLQHRRDLEGYTAMQALLDSL